MEKVSSNSSQNTDCGPRRAQTEVKQCLVILNTYFLEAKVSMAVLFAWGIWFQISFPTFLFWKKSDARPLFYMKKIFQTYLEKRERYKSQIRVQKKKNIVLRRIFWNFIILHHNLHTVVIYIMVDFSVRLTTGSFVVDWWIIYLSF